MADCKRCDRCGDFYNESDTFKENIPKIAKEKVKGFEASFLYSLGGNRINFGKIDIQSTSGTWLGPIDLCSNCGETLYKWLKNEKEEENGEPGTEKTKKKT